MKQILALHTGGTISMSKDVDGGVILNEENPLMNQRELFQGEIELTVEELFNLPSPQITLNEMFLLKERILEAIEEGMDGVVITHGTDTLEETAYFLELTIPKEISVVLTGAMRSSNEIGSDGLYNFMSAVWTAASEDSKDKGVLVVMNDEIHMAKYVTKTHTTNVATFRTPTFGPIGMLTKGKTFYTKAVLPEEVCAIESIAGNVFLIKAYAGMDGQIFKMINTEKLNGVVIEALGAGNLPPAVLPELQRILDLEIPVLLVSRCSNGIAEDIYAYEGGGVELKERGVVFAKGINGQKARIRLLVGINSGKNKEELNLYLAGE